MKGRHFPVPEKRGIMGRSGRIPPQWERHPQGTRVLSSCPSIRSFCVTQVTSGAVPVTFCGKEQQNSSPSAGSQPWNNPSLMMGTAPAWGVCCSLVAVPGGRAGFQRWGCSSPAWVCTDEGIKALYSCSNTKCRHIK